MTIGPTAETSLGLPEGTTSTNSQVVNSNRAGVPISSTLPLPHFRLRLDIPSVTVWDGQTLVLSVPKNFGRVSSETNNTPGKTLIMFVTPRIVDAAGIPAHWKGEF